MKVSLWTILVFQKGVRLTKTWYKNKTVDIRYITTGVPQAIFTLLFPRHPRCSHSNQSKLTSWGFYGIFFSERGLAFSLQFSIVCCSSKLMEVKEEQNVCLCLQLQLKCSGWREAGQRITGSSPVRGIWTVEEAKLLAAPLTPVT